MVKKLTQSLEDYLEAIYVIGLDSKVVRVKEVAQFLEVKTPSVVDAVSKLKEAGFVQHEKYGYLELTEKGREHAKKIYTKHERIYKFFKDILNVSDEVSKKDACKIEHHISRETMDNMVKLIKFIDTCPSGYPDWMNHFKYYLQYGRRPSDCTKKSD